MSVYCTVGLDGWLVDTTKVYRLEEPLACGNRRAHAFQYTAYADGTKDPADLTGVSCSGWFYRLNDGTSEGPLSGTVSGNVAKVILPASCYSSPGRYRFTMDLAKGSDVRTVMWVEGSVEERTSEDTVSP